MSPLLHLEARGEHPRIVVSVTIGSTLTARVPTVAVGG